MNMEIFDFERKSTFNV